MTDENQAETKTVYELGYHLLPTIPAEQVEAEVGKIRAAIEKRGGAFITEGSVEEIALSYPIVVSEGGKKTHYERAHFGWIKFEMEPEEADALKKEDIDTNATILRSVMFKTVREDTRAHVQTAAAGVLREVETTGTIERREHKEEKGEVSEEDLEKSIGQLVGEENK